MAIVMVKVMIATTGCASSVPDVLLDDVLRRGGNLRILDDQALGTTEPGRLRIRIWLLLMLLGMMDHAEGAGRFH